MIPWKKNFSAFLVLGGDQRIEQPAPGLPKNVEVLFRITARPDRTDHLFQIHWVDTLVHHANPTPDIGLQEWGRSWAAE